jgi:hypothetical protein
LIADTGATNTFVTIDFPVTNRRLARNPFSIKVPSGHTMTTTHEADLVCDILRPEARRAHIVPGLNQDCSLLSIGTLCDAGYAVTFNTAHMHVHDGETLILIGHRNPLNGLWHVDLAQQPIHMANSIGDPTATDLVTFSHASLFSPVLSTLDIALTNNWLTNFPGLSVKTLRKIKTVLLDTYI